MNTVRARVWQFQVQEPVVTVTEVGQGELPVGLARLIHINALACDHNRVLDYRTKQLEVRLLASYLHAAGADGSGRSPRVHGELAAYPRLRRRKLRPGHADGGR